MTQLDRGSTLIIQPTPTTTTKTSLLHHSKSLRRKRTTTNKNSSSASSINSSTSNSTKKKGKLFSLLFCFTFKKKKGGGGHSKEKPTAATRRRTSSTTSVTNVVLNEQVPHSHQQKQQQQQLNEKQPFEVTKETIALPPPSSKEVPVVVDSNQEKIGGQQLLLVDHENDVLMTQQDTMTATQQVLNELEDQKVPDALNSMDAAVDEEEEDATIDDFESQVNYLLEPVEKEHTGRKCLVLDLDETLIHSSFKTVAEADFIVPVEIDGNYHNVFVLKRPGVDAFMKKMGELYEIVIFTASLSKYADPVLDQFDLHKVIHHRLFREACNPFNGSYVKDLSRLGRDLRHVIILDNTPASYSFHPSNAVPVSTWFNDQHDSELIDLIPFLEDLSKVDNVVEVLNISLLDDMHMQEDVF